jgi:hydroxymethylbilane synthase
LLVIGSRGSKLALWQANYIHSRLEALGHECRIEVITTTGDRFQSGMLREIGNKGLFTKEIEEALLARHIDVAVHSLKDMPTALPDGLAITAIPEREDPRDALVGARLEHLPAGARVGTGSLRRVAQLAAFRPDLKIEPVRGNVDTRLRKLDEGQFEAIVLACAGLNRLGWRERIAEALPVTVVCPAVGQGALAIETRADDGDGMQACRQLEHAPSRAAVTAERAVLERLGGGCQVPVGAYAEVHGNRLFIRGIVCSTDGRQLVRDEGEGDVSRAHEIGHELGGRLLEAGAREILGAVYGV